MQATHPFEKYIYISISCNITKTLHKLIALMKLIPRFYI